MRSEQALRTDLLACLHRGLAAVDPARLVTAALRRESDSLPADTPITLIAFGKAAAGMAAAAHEVLGTRLAEGLLIVPAGQACSSPPGMRIVAGGHPLPDEGSVTGATAAAALAQKTAARGGAILCLISGGGSALLTLPARGVTVTDLRAVTWKLLQHGATIAELNAVRKHLEQLKGGGLAFRAQPAPMLALVLSDVVGDSLEVIASGPVVPDHTAFQDAVDVLKRHRCWADAPSAIRRRLEQGLHGEAAETPRPGAPCFRHVRTLIVGSVREAVTAAARQAAELGYSARVLDLALTGEARTAGRWLARRACEAQAAESSVAGAAALFTAGETTVTVRGAGRGGRNQELVLAAAFEIDGREGIAIGSLGTDGIDGPTDAAGAVATGTSLSRARAVGLDAAVLLNENDSYHFFAALGDHIKTGPTGTNVMDLQAALIAPRADETSSAQCPPHRWAGGDERFPR
ncbi:MAG: DUF4147 domain-containing protein [Candidatus Eisenbacteria sp.]|nr:DUF4147 domain-containing protein [Candidatus Eisenbacteria bacterium]